MLRRKIEKDIMHWIESSEERITCYPICMVMFLQDNCGDFADISVDKFML